ncbi:MAG: LPS-assembly protein LptD [Alphaproteobacteria bacterium]|nr:LPS-assembly protein LptD [Alphaproteobacteria bacterium]
MLLAVLVGVAVLAATVPAVAQRSAHSPSQPILFQADQVEYDQDLGLTVARGHVELDEANQILLADTVTYNQRTDTVTASGHVSMLQPEGDIVFADYMELHDQLRDGFITDVRILLTDRSRLAANTGRRIDGGNRTELRRGVYSPCELCKKDPTKPPVWQIKAERIVHDKPAQRIKYYDATMDIDGWPIFYTPYFSHPDPTVKRASGFLPPIYGAGATLGLHITTPYFWAIAPDKDITFRPMITQSAGFVLDQEYRQDWGFGRLDLDGSIGAGGPEVQTGPLGVPNATSSLTSIRGHFFGNGIFDLNQNWRTGFGLQRVSDQAYLLEYHFPQPTNFLTSHVFAEDFGPQSYGNISAYSFQSLNSLVGDGIQPIVLPTASYDWTSNPDRIGGRLELSGNVLNLERHSGADMRRVSTKSEWRLPFNGPLGDRYAFSMSLRADGYDSDNVQVASTDQVLHAGASGRVFPQAALLWRYPWVRSDFHTSEVIEPMAGFIAAPNGGNPAIIPNEDSQGFEFDETSLFRPDRLPGYDRVDSGQRVDYGLHTGIYNAEYGSSSILVGQSYRLEKQSPFQIGSGLENQMSDVVGHLLLSPSTLLDLHYRMRLDHATLAMRRQEMGVSTGPTNLRVSASFISFKSIPGLTSPAQIGDQISVAVNAALTQYWSLGVHDTRNISQGGNTIYSGVDLTYQDDCLAVTTSVQQSGITVGDVHPGVSVLLTFVFKNLGSTGVKLTSMQE